MAKLNVDGNEYKVTENMGFNHDVGTYCKMVMTEEGEKMAVKTPLKTWRFWGVQDRIGHGRRASLVVGMENK